MRHRTLKKNLPGVRYRTVRAGPNGVYSHTCSESFLKRLSALTWIEHSFNAARVTRFHLTRLFWQVFPIDGNAKAVWKDRHFGNNVRPSFFSRTFSGGRIINMLISTNNELDAAWDETLRCSDEYYKTVTAWLISGCKNDGAKCHDRAVEYGEKIDIFLAYNRGVTISAVDERRISMAKRYRRLLDRDLNYLHIGAGEMALARVVPLEVVKV